MAEPEPMLPGIRFLLTAIILSASVLIFGLGAAALLRAAHEEVANIPARRVMAEPVFAHQPDAPAPTLALLRLEPVAPEKAPDTPPADTTTIPEPVAESAPVPKVETKRLAALTSDDPTTADTANDTTPAEATKPEITAMPEGGSETSLAETPVSPPASAEASAPTEARLAALDTASPPPSDTQPVAFEQIAPPAMTDTSLRTTKSAALGGPAAKAETTTEAKKAGEESDPAEIRRKKRAERARERRRQAARRARLAAQQAAAQQTFDPFSQALLSAQPAPTTARRRQ
ncbi:MAG: hypothetical protein R3D82_08050 [Xanthobacteraceae bacterium]